MLAERTPMWKKTKVGRISGWEGQHYARCFLETWQLTKIILHKSYKSKVNFFLLARQVTGTQFIDLSNSTRWELEIQWLRALLVHAEDLGSVPSWWRWQCSQRRSHWHLRRKKTLSCDVYYAIPSLYILSACRSSSRQTCFQIITMVAKGKTTPTP